MTYFTTFELPPGAGFRLVAGHPHSLQRLLVASGCIPAGDPGRMHLHAGEEVIRVLSGELVMRVGDERRTCRQGDLAAIPPDTLRGDPAHPAVGRRRGVAGRWRWAGSRHRRRAHPNRRCAALQ